MNSELIRRTVAACQHLAPCLPAASAIRTRSGRTNTYQRQTNTRNLGPPVMPSCAL